MPCSTAARSARHPLQARPAARLLSACGLAARAYLMPTAALAAAGGAVVAVTFAAHAQDKGQEQPAEQPKASPPVDEEAAKKAEFERLRAEVERAKSQIQTPKPQPGVQPASPAPGPSAAKPQPETKPEGGDHALKEAAKRQQHERAQQKQPGVDRAPGARLGAQNGAAPGSPVAPAAGQAEGTVTTEGDRFIFDYSEPVDITLLVNEVRDALDLQIIATDNGLQGQQVVLTSKISVPVDQVLDFLNMLLEQKQYTIVRGVGGVYVIQPSGNIPAAIAPADDGKFYSTRIIPTPGMKPSSLQAAITNLITTGRGGAGIPGGGPVYLDDLGLIVMTDSPRVTAAVQEFITRIVQERTAVSYMRFPLNNIAASSARERVLELLGSGGGGLRGMQGQVPGQPMQMPAFAGASLSNLPERLSIDPSSNALILRGRPDEGETLTQLLTLVDVVPTLISRWYPVGTSTAEAVASAAQGEQLGDVNTFEASDSTGSVGAGAIGRTPVQRPGQNQQNQGFPGVATQTVAGSGFVIYPESGGFVYRGTEAQHQRVAELIRQLADLSARDEVVYEFYKLRHSKSEDVAEIIQNLLSNTVPSGNQGGLLGRDLGGSSRRDRNPRERIARENVQAQQPAGADAGVGAEGGVGDLAGEDVFVLSDDSNNQVLVKAPKRLQPQFRALIDRLDLRRPQVFISAQIIAITETDNFRLAVEAQQIIGQFAFQTNFGLASPGGTDPNEPTATNFLDPKNPRTDLPGLTAALIRSKDVPFIVTALANTGDSRIVASPQLLVDDNEEATIASVNEQPTLSTSQGTATTQTSFTGFEAAGPTVTVTPQISEGGYLKLAYDIELSSFVGDPVSEGVPPARQTNTVASESVTVPSDATIVVGGLTFENVQDNVIKIPLLGDIPIVGQLFRDTRKNSSKTTLYIFITPKIMRDPSFADLRLLTRMPLAEMGLDPEFPPPEQIRMDMVDTAEADTRRREEQRIDRQRLDFDPAFRKSREGRKVEKQEGRDRKKGVTE